MSFKKSIIYKHTHNYVIEKKSIIYKHTHNYVIEKNQ